MIKPRLLQYQSGNGNRRVILASETAFLLDSSIPSIQNLARQAIENGKSLLATAELHLTDEAIDLEKAIESGNLLPAIDHFDQARLTLAGTGLTHLGSAEGRDAMHKATKETEHKTDSMRMFLEGVEGGKPETGEEGAQPEWFYKGDGQSLVGPRDALTMPAFAKDGGEEPELSAIYMIGPDGTPWRLGFALANEFSDHVTERHNYLWLAHSKLRKAALGAELLVGEVPANITGMSRIKRDGSIIWEKPFLTGEDNMSHSIANLEAHHFKYPAFRRPGDIHVHFLGTATLSCADGIETKPGDIFEIEADAFSLSLENKLERDEALPTNVKSL